MPQDISKLLNNDEKTSKFSCSSTNCHLTVFQSSSLIYWNFCRHEASTKHVSITTLNWNVVGGSTILIINSQRKWFDFFKYMYTHPYVNLAKSPPLFDVTFQFSLHSRHHEKAKKFLARKIEEDKWLSFVCFFLPPLPPHGSRASLDWWK